MKQPGFRCLRNLPKFFLTLFCRIECFFYQLVTTACAGSIRNPSLQNRLYGVGIFLTSFPFHYLGLVETPKYSIVQVLSRPAKGFNSQQFNQISIDSQNLRQFPFTNSFWKKRKKKTFFRGCFAGCKDSERSGLALTVRFESSSGAQDQHKIGCRCVGKDVFNIPISRPVHCTPSSIRCPPYAVCSTTSTVRRLPYAVHRTPSTVRSPSYAVHRTPSAVRRPSSAVRHSLYAVQCTPSIVRRLPYAVRSTPSPIRCPSQPVLYTPSAVRRPQHSVRRTPSAIVSRTRCEKFGHQIFESSSHRIIRSSSPSSHQIISHRAIETSYSSICIFEQSSVNRQDYVEMIKNGTVNMSRVNALFEGFDGISILALFLFWIEENTPRYQILYALCWR
ncbi:unnamed protein product [Nesidiocoris tenuis]|uniref:Uncharacterized protein n=1 Tax=Nesidiocoris tenuis TaxID=355587 RepID=A0A6H5G3Y1_9HEMI|nr:unnamed protein product [Nesidiocoris tenuis]